MTMTEVIESLPAAPEEMTTDMWLALTHVLRGKLADHRQTTNELYGLVSRCIDAANPMLGHVKELDANRTIKRQRDAIAKREADRAAKW